MNIEKSKYLFFILTGFFLLSFVLVQAQQQPFDAQPDSTVPKQIIKTEYGPHDTILLKVIVVEGEVIGGKELGEVFVWGGNPKDAARYWAAWTRLRNAVYITYPYAKTAGVVLVDVNKQLQNISIKSERKKYIKSREKDLRGAFTNKVTDLSIYQGKVLMKLINRQTGNNCFEIIKEMKGGFTAGFYQTLMFVAGSSLKQQWNPSEEKFDRQIESIVQEIDRMYYGAPPLTTNNR